MLCAGLSRARVEPKREGISGGGQCERSGGARCRFCRRASPRGRRPLGQNRRLAGSGGSFARAPSCWPGHSRVRRMARRLVVARTEEDERRRSIWRSRAIQRSGRRVIRHPSPSRYAARRRRRTVVGPAASPDMGQPTTSRHRRCRDHPDREEGTLRWCSLALQYRRIRCTRDGVSERHGARRQELHLYVKLSVVGVKWQHVSASSWSRALAKFCPTARNHHARC